MTSIILLLTKDYALCLGNISKGFRIDNMKKQY